MHEYPDRVIPISYHTYFEGSSIDDIGKGLNGTYSKHFKVGATLNLNINRKEWNLSIMPGSKEDNKVNWYEKGEFDTEAIASVDVVHSWDSVTRKVTGQIDIIFEEAPTGDKISVGLFVVEDSIIGGPRYDQYTDYWYHGKYPELEEWGTQIEKDSVHFAGGHWIEGYPHQHAFRESVLEGDFWGTTTAIPANAEVGKKYSVPFSHTMPADYHGLDVRDKQVSLVALLAYKEGSAINVNDANLVDDAVSITDGSSSLMPSLKGWLIKHKQILLQTPQAGEYQLTLYSMNGREIVRTVFNANAGEQKVIDLSREEIAQGGYIVTLHQGENLLRSERCFIQ